MTYQFKIEVSIDEEGYWYYSCFDYDLKDYFEIELLMADIVKKRNGEDLK